jgi:hypothetical protein
LLLPDLLARTRRQVMSLSAVSREVLIFASALVIGLVGVPLLIWVIGNRVLGPYIHGTNTHAGPMALLGDFFAGLAHGWPSYWLVALGPALLILLVRLVFALLWPPGGPPPAPPAPSGPSDAARSRATAGTRH